MLRNLTLLFIPLFGACAEVELASSEQPVAIPIGGVATNGVATNGVATNGVATNALATEALATGALAVDSTLTNPHVSLGLEDPNARIFMKYLVSCALVPGQVVKWQNHDGTINAEWEGALGLCPEWHTDAPSAACRQRVSSCILARNNAFGVSVMFSMRGDNGVGPITLAPSVPVHTFLPQTATPVASLAPCRRRSSGPQRDCGWSVASVGTCYPGDRVSVAEGNYERCTGTFLGTPAKADMMLRVCDGISACDAARAIDSVGDACGSMAPGVDFICPQSGLFAVMRGAEDSARSPSDGTIEATSAYPAPEANVFRWREGAFYGDIFGRANLAPGKPQVWVDPTTFVVQGVVGSSEYIGSAFPNMFACSSENWTEQAAYMQRRVCAGPNPANPADYRRDCAATFVGACVGQGGRCGISDSVPVGDGDYDNCEGNNGTVYPFPLTSMLSQPCDAIPGFCGTVPGAPLQW